MIHIPTTPGPAGSAANAHSTAGDKPQPPMRFSRDSSFANDSPYRVVYCGWVYPTATHLFEAMNFLETRPDVAEMIRQCHTSHDARRLASQYQASARPDWSSRQLKSMEEVLLLKFRQHPDLRKMLLGTGHARIIYSNPDDVFWGFNNADEGQNHMGKALVHVRSKLQAESDDAVMGLLLC